MINTPKYLIGSVPARQLLIKVTVAANEAAVRLGDENMLPVPLDG
jgi:hypothetical protein